MRYTFHTVPTETISGKITGNIHIQRKKQESEEKSEQKIKVTFNKL